MENIKKKVGLSHLHGTPLAWDALNPRDLHKFIKRLDDLMEEKSEYYGRHNFYQASLCEQQILR